MHSNQKLNQIRLLDFLRKNNSFPQKKLISMLGLSSRLIILFCVCLIIERCNVDENHDVVEVANVASTPFTIYQFIPFHSFVKDGKVVSFKDANITKDQWFDQFGIRTAYVVYNALDSSVLKQTAHKAVSPSIISLDLEEWSFYNSNTPELIAKAVNTIKSYHPTVPVGVYGAAPVNTFGWNSETKQKYDLINPRYQVVANAVDILSPVLYSYQPSMNNWESTALYDIDWSQRYKTNKPIIPYLSINVNASDDTSREFTYDEMMHKLQYLKKLKANGCIVWAASKSDAPLDPNQTGWLRAMIDFSKTNSQ